MRIEILAAKLPHASRHLIARMAPLIDVAESGCWLWTGTVISHDPKKGIYGRISLNGRPKTIHRVAYVAAGRTLPEGYVVDHLCRVTLCVNPSHLEAVTPYENTMRGIGPGATNKAKTHCKNGHEFTPDNTYHQPLHPNHRACIACQRQRLRESRAREREQPKERHDEQRQLF